MISVDQPVHRLPGLRPPEADALDALGVRRLIDALLYLPARHEDWTNLAPIAELQPGDDVTLRVRVESRRRKKTARRRVPVVEVDFADDTGRLRVTFFNTGIDKVLWPGMEVVLQGRADFHGRLTLANPDFTIIQPDRPSPAWHPVYRGSEAMPPRKVAKLIPRIVADHAHRWEDPLPASVVQERNLLPLATALHTLHFPDPDTDWAALQAARERLAFTELFLLEAALHQRRLAVAHPELPPAFDVPDRVHERILARLPFEPTADQAAAFADVRRDLQAPGRMLRLLQGDVGTGKTSVAVYAMLATVAAGRQAVLLAPTEVLARQHHERLREWLDGSRVRIGMLTGSVSAAQRRDVLAGLDGQADDSLDIVVGTHALLEPGVTFSRLQMVVIDEQHRFGVEQRQKLADRGDSPHVLVMTATPIPRTLALAACGDLDVTNLLERPANRPPVETRYVAPANEPNAWAFIRDRIADSDQAYVVCPVVQESDRDVASVTGTAARIADPDCLGPSIPVGVLHGSLRADEKATVMDAFAAGETRVLVSSTVVEVGVDVAAATVMLVLHADQLGLIQLHQLRGRVGRGDRPGYCLLLGDPTTDTARERLRLLTETTDGFAIAEADLALRGPGEWFGVRQSGIPRLRAADLLRDGSLLEAARDDARAGHADPEALRDAIRVVFGDELAISPAS